MRREEQRLPVAESGPMISTPYLTLAEARQAIDEAIARATARRQPCAAVVADGGGRLVAACRMDDCPLLCLVEARQRAQEAAMGGPDNFGWLGQTQTEGVARWLVKNGRAVGAVAVMEGPRAPGQGSLPLGLEAARRLADRAIAHAVQVGAPVGVAVVDELGRLVVAERMDESALGSAEMAEAKAMTALKFRRPTAELTEEFRSRSARMRAVEKLLGFPLLAMGGGLPIVRAGRLVGAIGVSGSGAQASREAVDRVTDVDIARAALEE